MGLLVLLPAVMGGCPEFRNSSIDTINAATKSVILGDVAQGEAVDSARAGILDAAITLFFEQFRTDDLS